MAMLADTADAVIGVDTHTGTHTACLPGRLGRQLAVTTIPAGPRGSQMLLAWARRYAPGSRLAWAIEGTRSHGLGLTRYLRARDQVVTEAGRPPRASKRPGGKSGPADAARAARDALAAAKLAQPRADGAREALRILLAARCQATTARTAAVNTFKALILGAPDRLRQQLRGLSTPRQTAHCRALRIHPSQPAAEQVLRAELHRLAGHIRAWDRELRASKAQLHQLVTQVMPVLLDQPGAGPMSAAQLLVSWSHPGRCRSEAAFAALAGASPLEASSGKITRHRLNPFGDRQLNRPCRSVERNAAGGQMCEEPTRITGTNPGSSPSRVAARTLTDLRQGPAQPRQPVVTAEPLVVVDQRTDAWPTHWLARKCAGESDHGASPDHVCRRPVR